MSSLPKSAKSASSPAYAVGFQNAVEQRDPIPLRIKGRIPPWLQGQLYRTGPGTFSIPTSNAPGAPTVNLAHWFDGLGMTHRFEITPDGNVMYRNHSTAKGIEARIAKAGAVPGISFGDQDPCESIFSKFFTMFKPNPERIPSPGKCAPDEVNISVTLTPDMPGFTSHHSLPSPSSLPVSTPKYIVAKTDSSTLQILDPETLKPLHATSYAELDPRLDGSIGAAHSCRDKVTGEFFNFSLKLGARPAYKVFRVKPKAMEAGEGKDFEVDILAEINDAPAAYLHSVMMTAKYVILCVWQADYGYLAASLTKWNPNRDALFYVIDRKNGGVVSKFKTPPFFCFHALNAYDSDNSDDVVVDLSVYPDHSVIDTLYVNRIKNFSAVDSNWMSFARRFVLEGVTAPGKGNGAPRDAKVEWTAPSSIELPTIHPALYHKPYRFAYGINKDPKIPDTFIDRLVKFDTHNPSAEPIVWGAPGYTPGEPIFVPKPTEQAEDDGVVLSVVLDGATQKSMLVVLDAKDMTEVARAEMDTHFPFGFHGVWNMASL
ncbi:hypothetical protein BOTBODRAFT_58462 [Botryobasidium botryosum FD-172 SS1]|uniref:Carotenoid oxygenase n=1 Tax=Botryobasidium botryosum (strain FD-172 SS1) TaxID=930990 RepID=A0A067M2I7_BOTB1|nr:hypothetical protein BOTBODRAFT_58462 [Botryobasidium botryosum FD-172 SS1]